MEGIILVGGYMTGHTNNAMRPLGHSLFEASLPLVIIKTFPTSLIYHLIEVHRRVQIAETAFIFPRSVARYVRLSVFQPDFFN